jgi:hypothetical protein
MIRKSRMFAILFAVASWDAWGQADTDADPPSRVARLSYLSGSVAFRPGSVDDWSNATLNYPLTTGDHLWTDPGALAEVYAGLAAIRMGGQTAMAFLNLDDRTVQLSVTQGTLQIHVRSLEPDETFEVDAPNVAITLLRPGDYRIDVDGDNHLTTVTVRAGDAVVTGGGIAFPVHARQTARIRGVDTVTEDVGPAFPMDDFERWCEARDHREDQSISAQCVPREMTGYQDLDNYGTWSDEPDYGPVWTPTALPVGWAPYRYGRWCWADPWGWTWIDDAPWGFAPFHYGRWAQTRGVWVWVPGHRGVSVRPVYAPALVVFVGGPAFGRSWGWYPLGPGEVYRPVYRVSARYLRNANVRNVRDIAVLNQANNSGRHVNWREGAVTMASTDIFTGGRHIGREGARVNRREMEQAEIVGAAPRIPPRRESVLSGPVRGAPPARIAVRTVVVKTMPPDAPVAFTARQRALEANQGRPLDPAQVEGLRGNVPVRQPMVRAVAPIRTPRVEEERRPQSVNPEDTPRSDRQRRDPQPVPEALPPRRDTEEPSRGVSRPRRSEPEPRVEQPREVEQPRRVEQPSRVEQPRQVEQPRRSEQPRQVEQRRPDPPRAVEQPRQIEPRRPDPPRAVEQPRQVEQRRPDPPRAVEQPRREERRDPPAERPAAREERRDSPPAAREERRDRPAERPAAREERQEKPKEESRPDRPAAPARGPKGQ